MALLAVSFCNSDRKIRLASHSSSAGMTSFTGLTPTGRPFEPGILRHLVDIVSSAVSDRDMSVARGFEHVPPLIGGCAVEHSETRSGRAKLVVSKALPKMSEPMNSWVCLSD